MGKELFSPMRSANYCSGKSGRYRINRLNLTKWDQVQIRRSENKQARRGEPLWHSSFERVAQYKQMALEMLLQGQKLCAVGEVGLGSGFMLR